MTSPVFENSRYFGEMSQMEVLAGDVSDDVKTRVITTIDLLWSTRGLMLVGVIDGDKVHLVAPNQEKARIVH